MVTPLITMLGTVPPLAMASPSTTPWMYLIGSGGAVAILTLLITTVRDLLKGRVQVRATRDADLTLQRDTAWKERDEERAARIRADRRAACESRNARRLWDWAARLKRALIAAGVPDEQIPPEPELEDCTTENEET